MYRFILHVVKTSRLLVVSLACGLGMGADHATAAPVRVPMRVMIDPGHGGSNPGAQGAASGVQEKMVTLAVATEIAAALRASGVDAVMTRRTDRTLTLRQRTTLANQQNADLFVSIHANASPTRSQRGFETYVLTPAAISVVAPALRSDAPCPRAGITAQVAGILDDIERAANQWEAADLATTIQSSLRTVRGRKYDRGVRQDAHHVLLGATMPAVLVEIGFVDHPLEGLELVDPVVQTEIAQAIASAIRTQIERSH
jgi:N-acetylmuramoyl-L-alanine amidase